MLLKKAFAFVPRRADENSSLADVDSETQMPELFHEAGDLVKCFEELGRVLKSQLQRKLSAKICKSDRSMMCASLS